MSQLHGQCDTVDTYMIKAAIACDLELWTDT